MRSRNLFFQESDEAEAEVEGDEASVVDDCEFEDDDEGGGECVK